MKKFDITNVIYYLFIFIAIILLINSLIFNDNNHSFLTKLGLGH